MRRSLLFLAFAALLGIARADAPSSSTAPRRTILPTKTEKVAMHGLFLEFQDLQARLNGCIGEANTFHAAQLEKGESIGWRQADEVWEVVPVVAPVTSGGKS